MEISTTEAEALKKDLLLKYESLTVYVIIDLCHNTRPVTTFRMTRAQTERLESISASIVKFSSEQYPDLPKRVSLAVFWTGEPPQFDTVKVSRSSSLGKYTHMYQQNVQALLRLIKERDSKDTIRANLEAGGARNFTENTEQLQQNASGAGTSGNTINENFQPNVFMAGLFGGGNNQRSGNNTQMTDLKGGTGTPKNKKTSSDERNRSSDRRELYDYGTWEGVGRSQGQSSISKKSKDGHRLVDEGHHRLAEEDMLRAKSTKATSKNGEIDEKLHR